MVLSAYSLKLLKLQVVDGESFRNISEKSRIVEQTIEAARGEIVDRNGRPLAVNDVSFNIVIDQTFVEKKKLNDTIYSLIIRMEENDEEWLDNLPISMSQPFEYLPDSESSISSLKSFVNINSSDPTDALFWLANRYDLEEEKDLVKARKIAGVRYRMEINGFSMSSPYTFATDVSMDLGTIIMEHSIDYPGAFVHETTTRRYVDGSIAPHIIGQVGPIFPEELEYYTNELGYNNDDLIGKSGIEKVAEEHLRGKDGTRHIEINYQGDIINVVESESPEPGKTLALTIDNDLQKATSDALEKQIKNLNATAATDGDGKSANAGAAAVLHVKTGEVLALANYPTYDLNTYNQDYTILNADPNKPLFDRALSGQYVPGSVFKPGMSVAGLAEDIITKDSIVTCNRLYTFYEDHTFSCLGNHGDTTVEKALSVSCNVFYYEIGRLMGIDNIEKYATELGLGVPTGIELPEQKGRVITPEIFATLNEGQIWTGGNVLQAAIGQMDTLVTPLQLANYTATIANRGKRMDVNIIKSIEQYDYQETLYTQPHDVAHKLDVSPDVFEIVVDGMVQTSRTGSARAMFANYPIDVAAKTGSPQTSSATINSTFIAFAPADDPEIAIAVVIENGGQGTTGAPVARDIFDYYFSYTATSEKVSPNGTVLP